MSGRQTCVSTSTILICFLELFKVKGKRSLFFPLLYSVGIGMMFQVDKNYFCCDAEALLSILKCKEANSSKMIHLVSCFHTSLYKI